MSNLRKSSLLLKKICVQIRHLYGFRYQTYNVHNPLHLVSSVFYLGNLWANSAFWYEDYNEDLRSLFHGTQGIDIQIVTAICIQQKIPELLPSFHNGSKAVESYERMSKTFHHRIKSNLLEYIGEFTSAVGKMKLYSLPNRNFKSLIAKQFGHKNML